jgi:O-antigen ligase
MQWLVGMLVLLPFDLIKLPGNMTLVDCWNLMAMPIFWLLFTRGHYAISWSYTIPMWLILVASFASTFAAPSPTSSLIVIVKEVYAYIWFITLTALLGRLSDRDFQRILVVWTVMVFVNGFMLVGQFISPELWRFTARIGGNLRDYEHYRPSGLFLNANSAALFQLLGFVPTVLASPTQKIGVIAGAALLITLLAPGSMGATLAFTTGFTVAMAAIFLSGRLGLIRKMFLQIAVILLLLGGLLAVIVSFNARYQAHFQRILLGRSERSSEGRFDLWQRGIDAYFDHNVFLWGVGPENFREVDAEMTDNQLHNDFLAFSVERGLLGSLGLASFAIVAVGRAISLFLINHRRPAQARLAVVVFLAAMVATLVESLTHQVFHFRELWLVLALQEAMFFKMTRPESGMGPIPLGQGEQLHRRGFAAQPRPGGAREAGTPWVPTRG